jgi:hypothetical protein
MPSRGWVTVVLVTAVVVLGGCGGPPDESYMGRRALEHLSAVERAALADKQVTLAELKQASQVYVDCVTKAGATPEPGQGSDPGYAGPSGFAVEYSLGQGVDADVMEQRLDACRNEVNAVEDVWVLQHEASQADKQKAEQQFVTCARRAGLAVAADADWMDASRKAVSLLQDSGYYGHASGSPAPSATAGGVDVAALGRCVDDVSSKTSGALPGLAEALATLDPSAP